MIIGDNLLFISLMFSLMKADERKRSMSCGSPPGFEIFLRSVPTNYKSMALHIAYRIH